MKEIIYRKIDLVIVGSVQAIYPVIIENPLEWEIENNVITNFGGTESDYTTIETDLTRFHLENQNGVVVAVEDGMTIEEQRQSILTELERLDLIVPRIVEDILSQSTNLGIPIFTIHQSKLDIITQKETLRQQLQELEW